MIFCIGSGIIISLRIDCEVIYKLNKRIGLKMKKFPRCVYGYGCYCVYVKPNCTMPAFMCETSSKNFD